MEIIPKSNRDLHVIRSGEIVFEIDNECHEVSHHEVADTYEPFNPSKSVMGKKEVLSGNRHEHFQPYPTRKNGTNFIRSRFVQSRQDTFQYEESNKDLRGIDAIPGERLHIDMANRVGRITDALFDPENQEIYIKLVKASAERPQRFFLVPGEYVEVNLKSDAAFWEWVFWMRRICDGDAEHNSGPERHPGCASTGSRRCRPVQNIEQLPTYAECAAAKKVLLGSVRYSNPEQQKDWEAMRKENDPDYVRQDGNQLVLTPWLAGTAVAEAD